MVETSRSSSFGSLCIMKKNKEGKGGEQKKWHDRLLERTRTMNAGLVVDGKGEKKKKKKKKRGKGKE